MKNQGKTLEPLARKLRRAAEGDDAADGAKSRLRLLSDEVVRVVASYLPAVETPGVRPPAATCYRCGGAEGQVRRLRTCGCARARTYCDGCRQVRQTPNPVFIPCEASCQMPPSYVPSTTLLRFVRRAAGSSLSRRDRDMAALAFVKLRLLEAGREVAAERWRNVLGDDFRPAPRISTWLRRFGHTETAIQMIQPGGAKFAQWFQRASLTQRRTRRVPEDYATVQKAVWAANAGDRVLVAPGTYNEAVVVAKDVIIEPSSGRATIQSVEVSYGVRDEPTVFLVNLDLYCPAFIRDRPACKVEGARLVMVGCHVRSASVSGVVAEDDWAQLRLIRCLLHDCGESGVFVRGAKCALDDCRFLRNKASGLSAHGRAEASAKGCHFLDNKENGVHASNATVTLRYCRANGNERRSTFCQHGGRVDVEKTCSLAASVGAFCIRSGKGANRTPRTEAQARAAAAILPPAATAPPPPADAGASSPAPAAAVDLTAGADFVVPPVRQSYTRRAPD